MIPLIENISIELNENIINQNYQKSNYIKKESKKSFNEEFKTRQNSIINDLFIPNQLFKYLLNIYFAT